MRAVLWCVIVAIPAALGASSQDGLQAYREWETTASAGNRRSLLTNDGYGWGPGGAPSSPPPPPPHHHKHSPPAAATVTPSPSPSPTPSPSPSPSPSPTPSPSPSPSPSPTPSPTRVPTQAAFAVPASPASPSPSPTPGSYGGSTSATPAATTSTPAAPSGGSSTPTTYTDVASPDTCSEDPATFCANNGDQTGFFQDTTNYCQTFYQCYAGGAVCYPCPQGTLFNAAGYCDTPSDVTCPNAGVAGKSATHRGLIEMSGLMLTPNLTAVTMLPAASSQAAYTCPSKLDVTMFDAQCRTGHNVTVVAERGACLDATLNPGVKNLGLWVDSYTYSNAAGEGAVRFFKSSDCSGTPVTGFIPTYEESCLKNDPTTIDGSFNVPGFPLTPLELGAVGSLLYNASWC